MSNTPRHLGFIVDGNRRWAKSHGLPSYEGHLAGYNALRDVVLATVDAGVEFVSIYTFSTENWQRAESEVNGLMKLMMRLFKTDRHILIDNGIRLLVLGSREGLPENVNQAIDQVEAETAHCRRGTLAVCFNYGGQQEIVHAVRGIVESGLSVEQIDEQAISERLYQPSVPPVDMIVRTSGEKRLSNFMLWRSPYSELMFIDKLWPDMRTEDVAVIIEEYNRRQRRFGG